jgi:hypothetical protein
MTDSITHPVGFMRVRRYVVAEPKRTGLHAWRKACEFVASTLNDFGCERSSDMRDALARLDDTVRYFFVMRALANGRVRFSWPQVQLELCFVSDDAEAHDDLDPLVVVEAIPATTVFDLTFVISPDLENDDACLDALALCSEGLLTTCIEFVESHVDSEPGEPQDDCYTTFNQGARQ